MKLQARNFVVRKPETIDITMFFKKFCIATRTIKVLISQEIGTFSVFLCPITCSLFSLTQAPTPTVRAAESTIPRQRECYPLSLPLHAWLRPLHEHRCPARSSRSSSPTWRTRFLRPRRFAAKKRRTGRGTMKRRPFLPEERPPFLISQGRKG